MFVRRKARANLVYSVRDLCGLLPVLQSLDEDRIIAEVSRECVVADPDSPVVVKSWHEPMIAAIRKCLDTDLYRVLKGDERRLRDQRKLGPSAATWMIYMLSAFFCWNAYVSRIGSSGRKIFCGPSGFFLGRTGECLGGEVVRNYILISWYFPPPPFSRACSDLGRLLVITTRDRALFEAVTHLGWPFRVHGLASAEICILVDPQPSNPDDVAKAWTEVCLLADGE